MRKKTYKGMPYYPEGKMEKEKAKRDDVILALEKKVAKLEKALAKVTARLQKKK